MSGFLMRLIVLSCVTSCPGSALIHAQSEGSTRPTNTATPNSNAETSTNLFEEMAKYNSPDTSNIVRGSAALHIAQYYSAKPWHKRGDYYTSIQYFLASSRLGQKDAIDKLEQLIIGKFGSSRLNALSDLYSYQAWAETKSPLPPEDAANLKAVQDFIGRSEGELSGHTDRVTALAFSPDGNLLASGSKDNTVKIWDLTTGLCRATLMGHLGQVNGLAFSGDGNTLASASSDHEIRLWDVSTHQCKATLSGHQDEVLCVTFSPDGKLLASGCRDNAIILWTLSGYQVLDYITLNGHSGPVDCVAFSPNGQKLVSGSNDNTVRLWNVATVQCDNVITGSDDQVTCAYALKGNNLACGGRNGTVQFSNSQTIKIPVGDITGGGINNISWLPDSQSIVSQSQNGRIQVWDVSSSKCLLTIVGQQNGISSCGSLSTDGLTVATGYGNLIKLWYIGDGKGASKSSSMPDTSADTDTNNLLTNGSFEHGNFVDNGHATMSLNAGSKVIVGWIVTNAEITWQKDPNPYDLSAENGVFSLDLTGYHNALPYGGISQTVATIPGNSYQLSFYLGCVPSDPRFPRHAGPVAVEVSAGQDSSRFDYNSGTISGATSASTTVWRKFHWDFKATDTETTINIVGASANGGDYLGLDDIVLVPSGH